MATAIKSLLIQSNDNNDLKNYLQDRTAHSPNSRRVNKTIEVKNGIAVKIKDLTARSGYRANSPRSSLDNRFSIKIKSGNPLLHEKVLHVNQVSEKSVEVIMNSVVFALKLL